MEKKWILHFVSHTHWDREWYFSFQRFRHRLVKLMDRLIDLLEKNKDFKSFHMDGQYQAIKDYLEIRPENEERLRKLVIEGKLVIGQWYTQPTESLVSGESLIRNLMYGIKQCKRLGGVAEVCYLPDEFGNVSQLPQLLRGFGINEAVSCRGIPRNSRGVFRWLGSDGSDILMFYMNGGYGDSNALPEVLEDYTVVIDHTPIQYPGLKNRLERFNKIRGERATTKHLLMMNGSDHAFAQENLPNVIRIINEKFPEIEARHSTLAEYAGIIKNEHHSKGIPYETVYGEMFDPAEAPVLHDCHSTHADVKIWNDRIECLFEKWMEPFSTIAWLSGDPYPGAEIWKAWEYLLDNQFHDSIDSGCHDAVYRQVLTRFEWAYELGEEITNESLQFIGSRILSMNKYADERPAVIIFNPLCWTRDETMTASIDIPEALGFKGIRLMDGDDETPVVVHGRDDNILLKYNPFRGSPTFIKVTRFHVTMKPGAVPPVGYKLLKAENTEKMPHLPGSLVTGYNKIENEFFVVVFNSNGTFDIKDKRTNTDYRNMHIFEDTAEAGNGFEHIAPERDSLVSSIGERARISIVTDTPLKTVFKIELSLELPEGLNRKGTERSERTVPCTITTLVTLMEGVPRVDMETAVDNKSKDHRLRVIFPTGISTDHSLAGQPFDVVSRKIALPDLNQDWVEIPRPTHVMQAFVDVNDGEIGLMVANRGLYEYEVMDNLDRSIALTLLRCTDKLHGWGYDLVEEGYIPLGQCIGQYTFHYSITPHDGGWEGAYNRSYEFKNPMKAIVVRDLEEQLLPWYKDNYKRMDLQPAQSFVRIEPEGIHLSALKKHETNNSLIIRLFNWKSETVKGRFKVDIPDLKVENVFRVNLNEEREEPVYVGADGWMEVDVRAKGLCTIEVLYQ